MGMAYLVPFVRVEPDLGAKETRTVTVLKSRKGIRLAHMG